VQALVSTSNPQDEDLIALAAEALVWMGDPAQAKELLRKAYGGNARLRILVAQAATLFGEPALAKDLATLVTRESKASPQACVRQLTDLSLSSDDPKRACDILAAQFNDLAKPLDAARACGTDARCWLERLKDPDPEVGLAPRTSSGGREPRKRPLPWLARRGRAGHRPLGRDARPGLARGGARGAARAQVGLGNARHPTGAGAGKIALSQDKRRIAAPASEALRL